MNISSENFNHFRVTRYQNDAVTVADTSTGHASSFPGGWEAWSKHRAAIAAATKSKEDFIAKACAFIDRSIRFYA